MKKFIGIVALVALVVVPFLRPTPAHAYYSVCGSGCDYTTDGTGDEVEIQAAVDQAVTDGGGKVVIKTGTYYLAEHVNVDGNNIEIVGEGQGTRLINSYTTEEEVNTGKRDVFTLNGVSGIRIADMYMETAGWLIGQTVSIWEGCENIRVDNVTVQNGVDGISIQESSGIFLSNINVTGAEHGIGISDSEHVMLTNIDVRGTDEQVMQRGLAIWDSQHVEVNNFYAEKVDTTGIFIRGQKYATDPGYDTQYITISNVQIMDPNSTLEWGVRIEADEGTRTVNQVHLSNIFAQAYSSTVGDGLSIDVADNHTAAWISLDNVRFFARRNPMSVYAETGSYLKYVSMNNIQLYKTTTSESGRSLIENVDMLNISNIVSLSGSSGNYTALSIAGSRNVTVGDAVLKGRNGGGSTIYDFYTSSNTNLKYDTAIMSFVNSSTYLY